MAANLSWATDGTYLSNDTLSAQLRTVGQPQFRYRQMSDPVQEFGSKGGRHYLFTRQGNLGATVDGAYLSESGPIPRSGVSTSQGTLTVYESGQAIAHSEMYDTLSEFDTKPEIIVNALVNSMAKNIDYRAYIEGANASDVVYTPTGTEQDPTATWSITGTAGATATRRAQVYDIKNMVDAFQFGMYGTNAYVPAPAFDGENYAIVASIPFLRSISDDPAWEAAQYYGDPEKLFSGEKGRIYGARQIADNHIAGRLTSTTYSDECTMFAKDAVIEGVCTAEEVRDNPSADFNRDRASAWYYLGGFRHVWPVAAGDNRIIRLRSL